MPPPRLTTILIRCALGLIVILTMKLIGCEPPTPKEHSMSTATTPDTETAIIRDFLALPVEALPGAMWKDAAAINRCPPHAALRHRLAATKTEPWPFDDPILLHADRDGWRDYITVHA